MYYYAGRINVIGIYGVSTCSMNNIIKHMEISVGTYSSVRYLVEVRYWECPLIESPLYLYYYYCVLHTPYNVLLV